MPVQSDEQSSLQAGQHLTASIGISGAWNGVVKVRVSLDFLNLLASDVFSIPIDEVQPRDRVDSITELTNILGGRLKGRVAEGCELDLPQVVSCEEREQAAFEWCYFSCAALPLAIAVVDATSGSKLA